ncbi:polysaccharide biosynthesis tyrosine autokinase [Curtobacterium sp. ZW137]|uniref:polysaccharide biosynthesis tyrosine autokinase n=1 Tax=Curtobacterium sp. ZW137 TaxID=2485104 RepID=UPI000F956F59|nr:polysaccharide biosynthesis tyrosine autokinase [Curtobacterium sp. ZW137]ROP65156.1 capsular exopolysaccharide synthesis family protein [Curtobacterium sp. ZW137]
MTIQDFIRILRRSWLLVTAFVVMAIGLSGGLAVLTTPMYSTSTKLFVSVQSQGATASDLVQGNSAAQGKVQSYVDIVTSASVLQPVIDELGLKTSVPSLASRINASSPVNTVLITITVTDSDPAQAVKTATAVGESFKDVVGNDLEVPTAGGPSLVKIGTVQPPVEPSKPSSPKLSINLAVGLLAGILLGTGAAVLRATLDTKIRRQDDVEAVTDAPILGGIQFDPGAPKRPLIVQVDPRSPRAESFRTLRTNVQFIDLDESTRSFVVTSAVPSEGKSTTGANLAIAMAENGARVAIIDADLRRPRLAEILGVEGAVGLTDVLIGQAEITEVLQPWGHGGLHVIPAGRIPPNPSELLGSARMRVLLEELTTEFDYVIIDAPPLLPVTDAAILSRLTGGALVISAAGRSTRNQLRVAIDALSSVGSRTLGIVMTMLPAKGAGSYGYGTYYAYYGERAGDDALDPSELVPRRGRRAAPAMPRSERRLARQDAG